MSLTNITATISNGVYPVTTAQTKAAGVVATCQDESISLNIDNALISNNGNGTRINIYNSLVKIPNRDYALSYGTGNLDTLAQVNVVDSQLHWNLTNARKNIRFTSFIRSTLRSVKTNAAGLAFVYTQAGNQAVLQDSVFDGIYVHEVSGLPLTYKNIQYKNCGINLLNWEAGDLTIDGVTFGSGTLAGSTYTGADGVAGYTTYDAWLGAGNANNRFRFVDCIINMAKIAINLTPAAGTELCFKSFTRNEKFLLDTIPLSGAVVDFTPSASSGVSPQAAFNRTVNSNGYLTDGTNEYIGTELLVQTTVDSGTTRSSGLSDPVTIRNYSLKNITWIRKIRRADILESVLNVTPTTRIGTETDPDQVYHTRDENFTGTYSQAAAITGVAFAYNSGNGYVTVTVSEARSTQEVYNAWKHWTSQYPQFAISQTKLTMVNGILVIVGTLGIQGAGSLTGIYTDNSGTREEINIQLSHPGARLLLKDNTGAVRFNDVVVGDTKQFYFPAGVTGTWTAVAELYGYTRATSQIVVTGGGNDDIIMILVPDTTIVDTYAEITARTQLDTVQHIRDWLAYYNQTVVGIQTPISVSIGSDILSLTTLSVTMGGSLGYAAGVLTTGAALLTGNIYTGGVITGDVDGDIYHAVVVRSTPGIWEPSLNGVTMQITAAGTYDLRTADISGTLTVVNTSGGNVILQPPPTVTVVNTGPNVTLDYKERMTIASADGLGLSTLVLINGAFYGGNPIAGWVYNQPIRYIDVNSNDVISVYAHSYGYKPKIISGMGAFAAAGNITMTPEVIDISLDETLRNELSTHFSAGIDAQGGVFLAVNIDMSPYEPDAVLNALHYYLVKLGYMAAAGALVSGTTDNYKLIPGGLLLKTHQFYGKIADSVTVLPDSGIYLPIYVEIDPAVSAAHPDFKAVKKNTSGLLLSHALWTKQAAALTLSDRVSTAELVRTAILPDIEAIEPGASITNIRSDLALVESRLISTLG